MTAHPEHDSRTRRSFQKIPVRPINFLDETASRPPTRAPFSARTFSDPNRIRFSFSWKKILTIFGAFLIIFFTIWLFIPTGAKTPEETDLLTGEVIERPNTLFGKIAQMIFSDDVVLKAEKRDRINILLLGQGGLGHDGPYLTDTIMIASIKQSTKQVALISIPRDFEVNFPGKGPMKINMVNHWGEMEKSGTGAAYTAKFISELFDLPIHYYARIDFKAFEEIIDEVGGITINVERPFTDSEYPAANFQFQTVTFKKGEQTMNGERALIYARSRHGNNGEGSDFARAKRQQAMLLALKEKVLSFGTLANPIRITQIFNTIESHLSTNLSYEEIAALLKLAREELNLSELHTLVFDNRPDGFLRDTINSNGAYVLRPATGNMDSMRLAVQHVFENTPAIENKTPPQAEPTKPIAAIEVQNGTWKAGLGARTAKYLEDKDLTISAIGNTLSRPYTTSGAYGVSPKALPELVEEAAKVLGIPARQSLPSGEVFASTTDILIILGDDFVEPTT